MKHDTHRRAQADSVDISDARVGSKSFFKYIKNRDSTQNLTLNVRQRTQNITNLRLLAPKVTFCVRPETICI